MFYIKLRINGECKYLYNHRLVVYCWECAKAFCSAEEAQRYMRERRVTRERG